LVSFEEGMGWLQHISALILPQPHHSYADSLLTAGAQLRQHSLNFWFDKLRLQHYT
jgi:hypothetical protein